jgi:hypothetical protein
VFAIGLDFERKRSDVSTELGWDRFLTDMSALGTPLTDIGGDEWEYVNDQQGVRYVITHLHQKDAFKDALETEDLHLVYFGHSRYGRGACFGDGNDPDPGDLWEQGDGDQTGLFRYGYPYVGVHVEDIRTHGYTFAPVPVEWDAPERSERHPEARRPAAHRLLPEDLRDKVAEGFRSDSDTYWGFGGRQPELLLHANWTGSRSDPFDLGATDIKCRCFACLSCSTQLHFWRIFRRDEYKAWQKDAPPTQNFAYFTTEEAYLRGAILWIHHVVGNTIPTAGESWWRNLQEAKRLTNASLRRERWPNQIY